MSSSCAGTKNQESICREEGVQGQETSEQLEAQCQRDATCNWTVPRSSGKALTSGSLPEISQGLCRDTLPFANLAVDGSGFTSTHP